jgi:hypothetical protein
MSSKSKGKEVDKSSAWSQWMWDDRGVYVSTRYGPSGQLEYDFRYPSTSTDSAIEREIATPRTTGSSGSESILLTNSALEYCMYQSPTSTEKFANVPANQRLCQARMKPIQVPLSIISSRRRFLKSRLPMFQTLALMRHLHLVHPQYQKSLKRITSKPARRNQAKSNQELPWLNLRTL